MGPSFRSPVVLVLVLVVVLVLVPDPRSRSRSRSQSFSFSFSFSFCRSEARLVHLHNSSRSLSFSTPRWVPRGHPVGAGGTSGAPGKLLGMSTGKYKVDASQLDYHIHY